jgi:myo-inositol-hexaphosphate 3-phosphohydrolase
MKIVRLFFILLIILTNFCIQFTNPISKPFIKINPQLLGKWRKDGGNPITLTKIDHYTIKLTEGNDTHLVYSSKIGNLYFLNIEIHEKNSKGFFVVSYKFINKNKLQLILLNNKFFVKAILDGKLDGNVGKLRDTKSGKLYIAKDTKFIVTNKSEGIKNFLKKNNPNEFLSSDDDGVVYFDRVN